MSNRDKSLLEYWDSTGDWRTVYYSELHNREYEKLSIVEKAERDLDSLELSMIHSILHSDTIHNVLDIGCGVGRQILEFSEVYPNKYFLGIDISPYQIKLLQQSILARKTTNVEACNLEAAAINTLNKKFNLITFCNNSLGCLTICQRKKCLNNIPSIIAENGFLLISSFDKFDIVDLCYNEWNSTPLNIDYEQRMVDLGSYKSYWKNREMIIYELEQYSFQCILEKSAGLGSVYVFCMKR